MKRSRAFPVSLSRYTAVAAQLRPTPRLANRALASTTLRPSQNYSSSWKRISKVLDFVQFGGRNATELRTFEWIVEM